MSPFLQLWETVERLAALPPEPPKCEGCERYFLRGLRGLTLTKCRTCAPELYGTTPAIGTVDPSDCV